MASAAAAPAAADGVIIDEECALLKANFKLFLTSFQSQSPGGPSAPSSSLDFHSSQLASSNLSHSGQPTYLLQLLEMAKVERSTLLVSYSHLAEWHSGVLAAPLVHRWLQVEPYLSEAVREVLDEPLMLDAWRVMREQLPPAERDSVRDAFKRLPRYSVSLCHLTQQHAIRQLHAYRIGEAVAIAGTVTRSSAVRPELLVAAFHCKDCHTAHPAVHQQFRYTTPMRCRNPTCNNRTQWELDLASSLFVDWQSLKLQENSSDIPAGSMPRSLKVILRNEMVEAVKPGDKVVVTGSLIVVPELAMLTSGVKLTQRGEQRNPGQGVRGLKELGVRELNYSLVFLACHITQAAQGIDSRAEILPGSVDQSVADSIIAEDTASLPPSAAREAVQVKRDYYAFLSSLPSAQRARLLWMKNYPKRYTRIIQSLATSVHGHEEIKRGLLLLLLGGVHKRTKDGASLRGDINVCIVGDPSTSKSQFLKYICDFLPRAVYTSGKASSAAGLTASVVKDVETGEFGIEAGALMLADNGICCIDEFDKMQPTDQVAIHEAMEQQTISIAKAGIQATLNARTSVLAAANPIKGRYDRTKTLKQNVDISAPIMSRFDLFFVVLDEQDEAVDYAIAQHIIDVHCAVNHVREGVFSMEDLQLYVRAARLIRPRLTKEAQQHLVDSYVVLRANDSVGPSKASYRITVRQLESLIRLSEARARLDLSARVTKAHVQEAARLLKKSIVRVETGDVLIEEDEEDEQEDQGDDTQDSDVDKEHLEESKEEPQPAKEGRGKLQLKVSDYQSVSLELRRLLRLHEASADNPYKPNMKQQHLINLYLERHRAEIDDLQHEMYKLRIIIQLVINDHKILVVKPTAEDRDRLEEEDTDEERKQGKRLDKVMKRLLMCHPNFDGEEEGEGKAPRGRRAGYGQVRGGGEGAAEQGGEATAEQEEKEEKEEKHAEQEQAESSRVPVVQRVDSSGSVESGRRKRARGQDSPTVRETLAGRPVPLSPETPSTPSSGESAISSRLRGRRTPRS